MNEASLEVSFRHGKPYAAYLHLPCKSGARFARTSELGLGLLVDVAADGTPMGIEILNLGQPNGEQLLAALAEIHTAPVSPEDLALFRVARTPGTPND